MGVPFPLFENLRKKLIILLKDEGEEVIDQLKNAFDNTKTEAKIENEIKNSQRNFFFSCDLVDTKEKAKDCVKKILIEGLIQKSPAEKGNKKEEKEKRDLCTNTISDMMDSMIDGQIKLIETKKGDDSKDNKEEKKRANLFKVSFTKKSISISDTVSTWGPDLLLTGIQTYKHTTGKKTSSVNISREIPFCAREHTKKLNEIGFKIRQKPADNVKIKTKTAYDAKEKRFTLKFKKIGTGQDGKWLNLENFDSEFLVEFDSLIQAANKCVYKPFVYRKKT